MSDAWRKFIGKVKTEMPQVLRRSLQNGAIVDFPGDKNRARPWADAVELAIMTDTKLPGFSNGEVISILRNFQDPVSGLVPGPYGEDNLSKRASMASRLECGHSAYMVMATGYALECLGSCLEHPVNVAFDLNTDDLIDHLNSLCWQNRAWQSGAWIDHFASACFFNTRHHDKTRDMSDLAQWLDDNVDVASGVWGAPSPQGNWLQPVNGLYRLTRGAHAQFNWSLRYPESVIDTVLRHAHNEFYFRSERATACNVLDIIHPLNFCCRQTDYRISESMSVARYWLKEIFNQWQSDKGMSFEFEHGATPRLQGTEMWLSIAWLCGEILGITSNQDNFRPMGVHRYEGRSAIV